MQFVHLAVALATLAPSLSGQTTAAPDLARYDRAPWWMDKPIIASIGQVRLEILANRAAFSATYQVVDQDAAAATKAAADKVRALGSALAAYGADKVQVETTFEITPLYEQYRDKAGDLNDNQRADKIKAYQVSANVSVSIRDVRLAETVYATALAAKPSRTGAVSFGLEPENETKTQLFKSAVEDATRRARLAAEVSGAKLGAIKLIDPTGRACETDVLVAGAGRGGFDDQTRESRLYEAAPPPAPVAGMMASAKRRAAEVGLRPEDLQLPLQPPLRSLDANACVVFALSPG